MLVSKVPLKNFLQEVVAPLKNITDEIAENYIRLSAIEFCTRSQIVRRFLREDLTCNLDEYLLPLPKDEVLVSIYSCRVEGRNVSVVPEGSPVTTCGATLWVNTSSNSIVLSPVPNRDKKKGLTLTIATAPAQDACSVDALLYNKYYEAIVNGALAKLYLMKTGEWFNANLAQYYQKMFDDNVTRAGIDRMRNYGRGVLKLKGVSLGV